LRGSTKKGRRRLPPRARRKSPAFLSGAISDWPVLATHTNRPHLAALKPIRPPPSLSLSLTLTLTVELGLVRCIGRLRWPTRSTRSPDLSIFILILSLYGAPGPSLPPSAVSTPFADNFSLGGAHPLRHSIYPRIIRSTRGYIETRANAF
jgi:hypothetical protein